MSEPSDDILKRAFAQAPVVGADEHFVAALAAGVALRRRRQRVRRVGLMLLVCVVAMAAAWLLAPLALTTSMSELGTVLLGLPDQVGATAQQAARLPGAPFIGIALAGIALVLAAAAWLARRA